MDPMLQKHSPSIRISNKSRSKSPALASSETSSVRTEKILYGKNVQDSTPHADETMHESIQFDAAAHSDEELLKDEDMESQNCSRGQENRKNSTEEPQLNLSTVREPSCLRENPPLIDEVFNDSKNNSSPVTGACIQRKSMSSSIFEAKTAQHPDLVNISLNIVTSGNQGEVPLIASDNFESQAMQVLLHQPP